MSRFSLHPPSNSTPIGTSTPLIPSLLLHPYSSHTSVGTSTPPPLPNRSLHHHSSKALMPSTAVVPNTSLDPHSSGASVSTSTPSIPSIASHALDPHSSSVLTGTSIPTVLSHSLHPCLSSGPSTSVVPRHSCVVTPRLPLLCHI